ncbi:thiamine-phosphate kinase [Rhodococcus rhodnii]|uniref:Thiamine-monophosphate kinase n=1 Tax=Rhodococcus rhodnii LMG 5362 TaxID=1273125 RepID=R7WIP4_9NOCA|nr:thiamine-phosphate kinase [Rhodococcus rhodnii]EOM75073.1 thiamine monophosphate kinase [Rhodococcus rhodnii LMG 5362]
MTEVGEFSLIDRATARRRQPATTEIGPGDDAAVVRAPDGRVAMSIDMLVEGRHFRLDWSSPRDVGAKAVAQNAADIAAMGARPTAFVVGIGCPPTTASSVLDELSDGIGSAAEELGAGVVGGDLVQAPSLIVSVTVLGDLEGRAAVERSGARDGDVVAVAGPLGRSAAGYALLREGITDGPLVDSHRVPTPPYASALAAARGGAHAMIDVSDGLLADVGHIAAASGVVVDIDSAAVPVDPAVARVAAERGVVAALDWTLTGGEDHAFAATFADGTVPAGWTVIGTVRAASPDAGVLVDGVSWTGSPSWESFT